MLPEPSELLLELVTGLVEAELSEEAEEPVPEEAEEV